MKLKTVELLYRGCCSLMLLLCGLCFASDSSASEMSERRIRYDCEKKAAAYTYNLGKAGDTELFNRHVSDCIADSGVCDREKIIGVK